MKSLVIVGILAIATAATAQPALAKHMSKVKPCPCECKPSVMDRVKSAAKKAVDVVKPEPSIMTIAPVERESP